LRIEKVDEALLSRERFFQFSIFNFQFGPYGRTLRRFTFTTLIVYVVVIVAPAVSVTVSVAV